CHGNFWRREQKRLQELILERAESDVVAQCQFPTVGDYPRLTSPGAATLQDQARELCGGKTHSSAADAESSQRRSGCLSVPMATKSPTFYRARYAGRSKFKLKRRRRKRRRRLIEREKRWRPRRLGSSEFPKWQRDLCVADHEEILILPQENETRPSFQIVLVFKNVLHQVKNKAPAEVQITAEQLLREAKERELELLPPPPQQKITDEEELNDYKLRKRKTFEDNIRKNRTVISNWIKYAQWEESLKEVQRARSIYERALDVDYRNVTLWLKYAEMEMKNRQVNHARNIWDRAITILPRVNQFWYKYTYMEEMLGNVAGARQVFERWMEWQPEEQSWHSYINFELRYKEVDRARSIYERYILLS
ncbi:hypothetical protein Chor_003217, partial [Crotalus horridus]